MIKTINVTKRDLELGIPRNCRLCPVARAISRHLNKNTLVNVYPVLVQFVNNSSLELPPAWNVYLSYRVNRKITRYDDRSIVQPFTFEIDIPDWALR